MVSRLGVIPFDVEPAFATIASAMGPVYRACAPSVPNAPNVFAYAGLVSRVPAVFGVPSGLRKYERASSSALRSSADSEIAVASRGEMSKPLSDRLTAGSKRFFQAVRP